MIEHVASTLDEANGPALRVYGLPQAVNELHDTSPTKARESQQQCIESDDGWMSSSGCQSSVGVLMP